MSTKILQVENIEAVTILDRFDKLENAIKNIAKNQTLPHQQSEYATRREVCKKLKISLVTLHEWTRKGLLTAYKIGNRVYYKPAEVEAAIIKKGGAYENR